MEGFVVTMHEGANQQEVTIPRPLDWGIRRSVHPSALWQQALIDRAYIINRNCNKTFVNFTPRLLVFCYYALKRQI